MSLTIRALSSLVMSVLCVGCASLDDLCYENRAQHVNRRVFSEKMRIRGDFQVAFCNKEKAVKCYRESLFWDHKNINTKDRITQIDENLERMSSHLMETAETTDNPKERQRLYEQALSCSPSNFTAYTKLQALKRLVSK